MKYENIRWDISYQCRRCDAGWPWEWNKLCRECGATNTRTKAKAQYGWRKGSFSELLFGMFLGDRVRERIGELVWMDDSNEEECEYCGKRNCGCGARSLDTKEERD